MPNRVGFEQTKRVPVEILPKKKGIVEKKHTYEQVETKANSLVHEELVKIKRKNAKNKAITRRQYEIYTNPSEWNKVDRDVISNHFDLRIQLFFLQLITCYRVPYHFEWVEANEQYGKGGTYTVKDPESRKKATVKTQAAHSSTLPCLIAYPIDEWEAYKRGERDKPEGFVYLKYTHTYAQHNATRELADYVNGADCLIDGKGGEDKLRNRVAPILNEVAKGRCKPQEGIKNFSKLLKGSIDEEIKRLEAKDREEDPRYAILVMHQKQLKGIEKAIRTDPGYFDQLVGVNVKDHPKDQLLRKVVYQKRFKLIRECEGIENEISKLILDAQNKMLGTRKKSLAKIDYRLRYVLLENEGSFTHRAMTRLFATSIEQLRTHVEEEKLDKFEKAKRISSFKDTHKKEIGNLERAVRQKFGEMRKLEYTYRAELFKGLREDLNGWKGVDFVKKFNEQYPNVPMYPAKVSRIEQPTRNEKGKVYLTPLSQRTKELEVGLAKKISKVLKVDPGLFLPGIATSMY